MWFKQVQVFQLPSSIPTDANSLTAELESLLFKPCLPSLPFTLGWAPVTDDEDAPLVVAMNQCLLFCLQVEEKILPATVVRHALAEKIKQIKNAEDRNVRQKEKLSLKDDVMLTLLPKAFSKLTRIYAYIDTRKRWLVLGTTNSKKSEQFLSNLKKCIGEEILPFDLKKMSPIMTHWLIDDKHSESFTIEKSAVLQDSDHQHRVIRCQQQNLFADSIQALLKDGCEVKQLALSWNEQVKFILSDDFSLRTIQYQDEIKEQVNNMEAETKQQKLNADFFIMTTTLTQLLSELLDVFKQKQSSKVAKEAVVV